MNDEKKVLIMGAGGRDFHTYLTTLRDDPAVRVVCITAAQIPYHHRCRFLSAKTAATGQPWPGSTP